MIYTAFLLDDTDVVIHHGLKQLYTVTVNQVADSPRIKFYVHQLYVNELNSPMKDRYSWKLEVRRFYKSKITS